jgi:phosphoglycerol transferase MdoB-like AlkP superfamily enzyme
MSLLQNLKSKIPSHILFFSIHYLLGLAFLFIYRVILFFTYSLEHGIEDQRTSMIKEAFLIGVQFDSVVLGYILGIPMLFLSVFSLLKRRAIFFKIVHFYILTLIFVAFFISSADIPYFNYNFSRLSAVIFGWLSDTGIIVSMITEEPTYFIYTLVFIVFFAIYTFLSIRLVKRIKSRPVVVKGLVNKLVYVLFSLFFLFLSFFAMRGRVDSPIRINHAFFCNNSFYNQLGLNPTFTLLKSLTQVNDIKVYEDDVVIKNVQKYLGIKDSLKHDFPFSRIIVDNAPELKKNIVLVLMESMSANKMGRYGNPDNLTPFLDSLASVSYSFDNIYSAGIHMCDGIFSTLYSIPTVLRDRPMSALKIKRYKSVPEVLKKNGYYNIYFTTHSQTFDNVGSFLPINSFDQIVSQKDYDKGLIQNSFGIPDHVLFDYAVDKFDGLSKKGNPFFAALMTISDHGPYVIPDEIPFKPKTEVIKKQIVEYADWSIRHFMESVKTKDWYENTVFVFVADHGGVVGDVTYDIPLSFHHIPFIIHSPDTSLIEPKTILNYGGQIDVLPTVLGMLNFSYANNTLGVDLLKEKRPYAFFSSDDKVGCIDDEYFYIYRVRGKESLYQYKGKSTTNLIDKYKDKAESMRKYCISMIQAGKWITSQVESNNKPR